ncbi:MAG: GNAT family N-acetyltransferase [Caulobacter sp. 12-67-6]|nr:MAG: GNAT family N-acetyltransferase [Caulobacter sp. 12-67-6]OYX73069.1 MAG: GNAT family N-acetyltransferase [Caulobacter sp. 32-67-35]OYX95068.1 MAG: GNAT family N-acetyltransferase [Caulobacter sp. 35-67-4]OZA79815.1 MAG: GNAT family N-acetyltransferase [Caulobacter sp. 39-67-4]
MDPAVLEPIADRAWPARERSALGGWRLNATAGWSMRSNACWPLAEPDRDVETAIEAAEAWFVSRGLPRRFKLTEGATAPADLSQRLSRRGYADCKKTLVMVGPALGRADPAVAFSAAPDASFEAVFTASAGGNVEDARERLETLARIPAPARFARLDIDSRPAALGACAVGGEWVGLFGMRTAVEHRRKGLARLVLRGLLAEAASLGAVHAYLQVEADNAPAIALYEVEGFRTAYTYRYWVR